MKSAEWHWTSASLCVPKFQRVFPMWWCPRTFGLFSLSSSSCMARTCQYSTSASSYLPRQQRVISQRGCEFRKRLDAGPNEHHGICASAQYDPPEAFLSDQAELQCCCMLLQRRDRAFPGYSREWQGLPGAEPVLLMSTESTQGV